MFGAVSPKDKSNFKILKRPDSKYQTRITFNISYAEKDKWWKLAHENGMTLSEFIRVAVTHLEELYAEEIH